MAEVLDHAHFSLLPFLGFETCHSLSRACKQAAHLVETYPYLSLLEGTSKALHVAKEKRNKFFHLRDFDVCIEDFVVLKDGRIIVYDGRVCYLVDKNKEIRPLRGKLIKQFCIPLGIQGISLKQDMLFIAHGYTLKCYSICDYGNNVQYIENAPTLLHDDQDLDWPILYGCSTQEYYLFDHILCSAQTNQHIFKTHDARVFCSFSRGFVLCGKHIEIFYPEENTHKKLDVQLNEVKQVQASKCGSLIYVLERESLVCITRGQCRRIDLRAKCIYLQTHLYYITLDDKLFILH
jgi:hypothetical protein